MNDIEYIKNELIEVHTGGGCMVDSILSEDKKTYLILSDEGYSKITFKDYKQFINEIEHTKEKIIKEYGSYINTNDKEEMTWLLLDAMGGIFDFKSIESNYTEFNMKDEDDNVTCYSCLEKNEKYKLIAKILNV